MKYGKEIINKVISGLTRLKAFGKAPSTGRLQRAPTRKSSKKWTVSPVSAP